MFGKMFKPHVAYYPVAKRGGGFCLSIHLSIGNTFLPATFLPAPFENFSLNFGQITISVILCAELMAPVR